MYLLKYRQTDGAIVGSWSANTEDLLVPNIVAGDPTHAYLLAVSDVLPSVLQERWWIDDEMLVAKTVVQLTATPNPFVADGTNACWITVAPFHPCTVLLEGEGFALTEDDPQLLLTSAQPHTWEVRLQPQAQLWATPIVVEAQ